MWINVQITYGCVVISSKVVIFVDFYP
jgi:hypothetical protein